MPHMLRLLHSICWQGGQFILPDNLNKKGPIESLNLTKDRQLISIVNCNKSKK